jgi:hypothetical protein
LDGDGLTEIVVQSFDQKIYVWETPWTFNPDASPWPMFHHDPRHTGDLSAPFGDLSGLAPDPVAGAPAVTGLRYSPNPFHDATEISFQVTAPRSGNAAAPVSLEIFSATGRRVRPLLDRPLPAGSYATRWDGRDARGRPLGSGVYYGRLSVAGRRSSFKLTLLGGR